MLEEEIAKCPKCKGDHCILVDGGNHIQCLDCLFVFTIREPVFTSGQIYRSGLEEATGLSERTIFRHFVTLGHFETLVCEDGVRITLYPQGGGVTIPLPENTVSVDGKYLTRVDTAKLKAEVNVPVTISGQQVTLFCRLKD